MEFIKGIEIWLTYYKRLIEKNSGKPLVRAYYVQLKSNSNEIEKIIASSNIIYINKNEWRFIFIEKNLMILICANSNRCKDTLNSSNV